MKKRISLILALALLCALALPAAAADTKATTMRLGATSGDVSVKNAAGKTLTPKRDMRLYSGYTVATGADGSAYLQLDDSKALQLDVSTSVEVKQSGKKLEVSLTAGKLLFDVSEKLAPDESLNIRTSTMLTGVRGTIGWAEVTFAAKLELNAQPVRTEIIGLLEGELLVRTLEDGRAVSQRLTAGNGLIRDNLEIKVPQIYPLQKGVKIPIFVLETLAEDLQLLERVKQTPPDGVSYDALLQGAEAQRRQENADRAALQEEIKAQLALEKAKQKVVLPVDQVFRSETEDLTTYYTVTFAASGDGVTDGQFAVNGGGAKQFSVAEGGTLRFSLEAAEGFAAIKQAPPIWSGFRATVDGEAADLVADSNGFYTLPPVTANTRIVVNLELDAVIVPLRTVTFDLSALINGEVLIVNSTAGGGAAINGLIREDIGDGAAVTAANPSIHVTDGTALNIYISGGVANCLYSAVPAAETAITLLAGATAGDYTADLPTAVTSDLSIRIDFSNAP